MFLKTIILDGFKSYNVRTELASFDPYFNAITGLNGSGKSNILDAICFVLGITNLSHVRATNLQDLIYKNGQSGITKASVTIVFDNKDKSQSPIGYEDFNEITICRQVILGGRNKYLINGCNCTNSRIQDLFCSVQLNVNNPHFLIMQGKITKVLNMKPPEILSMLEEAAGTKMYETKRQVALKTLTKKDARLAEINQLIIEDITPTIEKLQKERSNYLEYQNVTRELEHIERQLIVLEYVRVKKNKTIQHEKYDTVNIQLKDFVVRQDELKSQLELVEKNITRLQHELDQKGGGKIKLLENDVVALSKEESVLSTEFDHQKQVLESLKNHIEQLTHSQNEAQNNYNKNQQQLVEYEKKICHLKQLKLECQEKYDQCQDEMQSLKAGMDADNRTNMIDDKIRDNKNKILAFDVEINQLNNLIKQLELEVDSVRKYMDILEENNRSDIDLETRISSQINEIKESILKMDYDPDEIKSKTNLRDQLEHELDGYKTQLDDFETENNHMIFTYNLPEKMKITVERKIKGTMVSLFSVNDQNTFLTAIEAAASSKLVNVVVDDDETVKILLKHGNLKKRTTFIVLNRMQAKDIASEMISKINSIEKLHGKVYTAASLISYDASITPAINYVFGATLICTSAKDAKLIVHKLGIHLRCVTLDGDIYEPSGTLTGGSRKKDNSIIHKHQWFNQLTSQYKKCFDEIVSLDEFFQVKSNLQNEYDALNTKLELKLHEHHLLKRKLESSPYFQTKDRLNELTSQIESTKVIISEKMNQINQLNEQNFELETTRQNAKQLNGLSSIKTLESNINDLKNNMNNLTNQIIELEEVYHGLALEINDFETENPKLLKEIEECAQKQCSVEITVNEKGNLLVLKQKSLKTLEDQLKSMKDELNACDHMLNSEIKARAKINNNIFEIQLKIKENNIIKEKLETSLSDATHRLETMERKHDWIRFEKKHFNVSGSAYDFRHTDENTLKAHLKELQSKSKIMSKQINVRAMDHLVQAEERYNELLRKKKIVEEDKQKICQIIRDLDEKKKETLVSAWQKVNKDFASIFSTLLPGATVKLIPVDRQCPLSGLEIGVGFGSVWKENLAELSGGQRSLVALSLILSLLLFNPAPIYILDEVDAALDISHTQNIGVMLRKHFKKSQFIIVSLKEGMFNNANVLFKTRFVDGSSTVTRHSQQLSENSAKKRSHHDGQFDSIVNVKSNHIGV